MAVSEQTISAYMVRTTQLRWQCASMLMIDLATLTWPRFVEWLIAQRPRWSRSTWRTYKRSVIEVMKREHPDECGAMAELGAATQTGARKKTDQTSAAKATRFGTDERERIFADLRLGRSNRALELIAFIRATCTTGLRPTEWRGAVLEVSSDGSVRLVVKNAKATNDRSHGPHRTLHWRHLPPETLGAISRTIAIARESPSAAEYEAHRKALQNLLGSVSRRLWPDRAKHFALYSCRREFIAQAKRAYSPVEIAALVGHSVDRTAQSHYGRVTKSGARDISLPTPDRGDVARVRAIVAPRLAALSRVHEKAAKEKAGKEAPSRELECFHDATSAAEFAETAITDHADGAEESPRSAESADADAPSITLDTDPAASIEGPTIDLVPEPSAQVDEAKEAPDESERLQMALREKPPIPASGDVDHAPEIVEPRPKTISQTQESADKLAPSIVLEGSQEPPPAAAPFAECTAADHEATVSPRSTEDPDATAPSEGPTIDAFPEPPAKPDGAKKARDEGERLWRAFQEEQRRSFDAAPSKNRHRKKDAVHEANSAASSSESSTDVEPKHKDIP
ncbi:hypothetical protein A1351_05410 [Methylosinus sp. R-45379]|uniref:hypothetical protein n=1 Tax=Methylosinus sp. R-45379 TaxID=980563 RepID=UPI0007C8C02A|nr:hypothetical protein [Methylosinus sp. R-45379]OAI31311.1 hypothetical protein A1351_05410 [Methylosinus sp. R-45379]